MITSSDWFLMIPAHSENYDTRISRRLVGHLCLRCRVDRWPKEGRGGRQISYPEPF